MTSTRKMLLGTAAATIAVTAGGAISAQAADALIRKAPPIQYVRICDQYGYGFWQIPGSSICLQLRGQLQSDNAYQPTHDILIMAQDKKTGANGPAGNFQSSSQQDHWGYEFTSKTRFDARTETSVGTLRAWAELKIQLDAGNFNGPPGPGGGETGAGNKSECFRCYLQWAGWTIGEDESIFSKGSLKDGELADVIQSDKESAWTVNYTWTPAGPGVPPKKGSAPVPDGWSFGLGIDSPLKARAKAQFGGGCTFGSLNIAPASPAGFGTVCTVDGPLNIPDFVARIHDQEDPLGKDPQHNDVFSLSMAHLSGIWHQTSMIATAENAKAPVSLFTPCGVACAPAFGPAVRDTGWAVSGAIQFYVPMLPGTKIGQQRVGGMDAISGNVIYCDGALIPCGIGGNNGNLMAGDAYWSGGLVRDDVDGKVINNGVGSYYIDKEKALAVNAQYHAVLTDCTNPVNCFTFTLESNYVWVTPGTITQNVDWTAGGLGKAKKASVSAEVSWGTSRNGSPKPVFWRMDFEVQYFKVWQDLPCNNNGNTGTGVCLAPTALPAGIAKDPSTWVWRTTISYDW